MPVAELVVVRHGQSVGNLAWQAAYRAGSETIDMPARDPDIELSALGVRQAEAIGRWLAGLAEPDRPVAVWTSPFVRARATARIALGVTGWTLPTRIDERLRDRELGVLAGLTWAGVQARFPDEADRRKLLGKLYYRPPGGESWADIALRLRGWLADLDRVETAPVVLVSVHDVIVLLLRYVLAGLDEEELFAVVRSGSVSNASVTRFTRPSADAPWTVALYNDVGHLAHLVASEDQPSSSLTGVGPAASGRPPA